MLDDTLLNQLSDEDLAFIAEIENNMRLSSGQKEELISSFLKQKVIINYTQNLFEKNLQAFFHFDKEIFDKFKNYKPSNNFIYVLLDDNTFDIEFLNKERLYSCESVSDFCQKQFDDFINKKEQTFYPMQIATDYYGQIHFRYLNEIGEYLQEHVKEKEHILYKDLDTLHSLTILGLGLGNILNTVYSRFDIKHVLCIENNYDNFYASLHVFDYANLLNFLSSNKSHIKFLVESDVDKIKSFLDNYYLTYNSFLLQSFSVFCHYDDENIRKIYDALYEIHSNITQGNGFFDDHIFAICHGIDILKNKYNLVRNDVELLDETKNIPIFIVGNGPSLDNDLPFLRKNQDKAIILACGTAVDSLYNAGIKADAYLVTERIPEIAKTLEIFKDSNFLDDLIVFASDVTHQKVLELFKYKAIFLKADEPLFWLWGYDNEISQKGACWRRLILMNPLVSNFGLSVSLELGFKNIYLFGVDNGTRYDRAHAKSSILYSKLGLSDDGSSAFSTIVKGNFGSEVKSSPIYQLSIERMNDVDDLYKNFFKKDAYNIYNCSDGAFIECATPLHSYDLNLSSYPNIDKNSLKEKFISRMTYVMNISDEEIKELINKERFNLLVDYVYSALSVEINSLSDLYDNIYNATEILYKVSKSYDSIYVQIIDGTIQNIIVQILYAVSNSNDFTEAKEHFNFILKRLSYLIYDAKKIFELIPDYILVTEHKKLLNNKVGFDHEDSIAPVMPEQWEVFRNKKELKKLAPFVKRYD